MTAGLPVTTELRDELASLVRGDPFCWQRIAGSYDLLRRGLVEAVRGSEGRDPVPLLEACWSLLSGREALEQVVRFYRLDPHYAGVAIDAGWLHGNACALVATAMAALNAQRQRVAAVSGWARTAAELLGRRGEGEPAGAGDRTPASAAELVDAAFDRLAEAGWRAEGARVWTLAWLPRQATSRRIAPPRLVRRRSRMRAAALMGPGVRVPVAGCFDGRGFLADLLLQRLPGDGELVAHPETALQPLGAQLLGGLRAAWEPSGESVCFTFGIHDAHLPSWVPLEGTSLSGAAALGFELLRRGVGGDVRRLVVAQVGPDGALEAVGHEVEKMQAALVGGVPSVVLADDSQVPETCAERFRQSGQEIVRARTLGEVLDLPPLRRDPAAAKRNRRVPAVMASVALVAAAIGGVRLFGAAGDESRCPRTASPDRRLVATAVWRANEQTAFLDVLQTFCDRTGIRVEYHSSPSDNMAGHLQSLRCRPPDVVMLPQPGLLRELARTGHLHPLGNDAVQNLRTNYLPDSIEVGAVEGVQYGVYFKASNKSLWWYNPAELEKAGVGVPADWDQMIEAAEATSRSGRTWMSIGARDGWTLTDLFENVYLRTAGPEMYDQLAERRIPWTHPSVIDALRELGRLLEDRFLAGGRDGVLRTGWRQSVVQVFGDAPQAATVFEGEFVLGQARETGATPDVDIRLFPFPAIRGSAPAVVGGGDIAVTMTGTPEAQTLLAFLATATAPSVWAGRSGFISPNRTVDTNLYPDALTAQAASTLASAGTFRPDLSDQQPPSFGANPDGGMWPRFQQFLRDGDPEATAAGLEADAAEAYAAQPQAQPCPEPARGAVSAAAGGRSGPDVEERTAPAVPASWSRTRRSNGGWHRPRAGGAVPSGGR